MEARFFQSEFWPRSLHARISVPHTYSCTFPTRKGYPPGSILIQCFAAATTMSRQSRLIRMSLPVLPTRIEEIPNQLHRLGWRSSINQCPNRQRRPPERLSQRDGMITACNAPKDFSPPTASTGIGSFVSSKIFIVLRVLRKRSELRKPSPHSSGCA